MLHSISGYSNNQPVVVIYIEKTTGEPYTGLTKATPGLVCKYWYNYISVQTLSLNLATPSSAYLIGSFAELSATYMPGLYRLDLNYAYSSPKWITYVLSGAADMKPCMFTIQVLPCDLYRAKPLVTADGGFVHTANTANLLLALNDSAEEEIENIVQGKLSSNNAVILSGMSPVITNSIKGIMPKAMQIPPEEE